MKDLKEYVNEQIVVEATTKPKDFSEFDTVYYDKTGSSAGDGHLYIHFKFYVKPSHGGGWTYYLGPTQGLSFFKWVKKEYTVDFKKIPENILDELKENGGELFCEFPEKFNTNNVKFDDIVKYFVPISKTTIYGDTPRNRAYNDYLRKRYGEHLQFKDI